MNSSHFLPTALVTGAAGFLGSHVVRTLVQSKRVRVVALDDLSGGFRSNVPEDVAFVRASVLDNGLLADLFDHYKFRYVYHLAAYAAEGLSHFIRRFNYTNNVVGSVNVINAAVRHEVECFVFTSSIAVYGAATPPVHENSSTRPEDPYGIAKLAVELDLRAAHEMFGLNYVIFRPHNVYGEYQNLADPYRNVVGIFMRQIMLNQPMTIFGDGSQVRAFSYVGDIVEAISLCPWNAMAWNGVFNVGSDTPYTMNELAHQVALAMGSPGHAIQYLPPRNEVKLAFSDHTKIRTVFSLGNQTPLAVGLGKMARWAKSCPLQSSRTFDEIEVSRNMPKQWLTLVEPSSSKRIGVLQKANGSVD